ncbi:MAG: hypothetical protein QXD98_01065 [Candidatus Diapherotrites archaeon]
MPMNRGYRGPRRGPFNTTRNPQKSNTPKSASQRTDAEAKRILNESQQKLKLFHKIPKSEQLDIILLDIISKQVLRKAKINKREVLEFFGQNLALTFSILNSIKAKKKEFTQGQNEFLTTMKNEITNSNLRFFKGFSETELNNFLVNYFQSVYDLEQAIQRLRQGN